jgi:hypothetical protein
MIKTFRMSVLTAALGAVLAIGQQTSPNATRGSHAPTLPPPGAPKENPGFGDQVPNRILSGQTPKTNSTLQKDGNGITGSEYFGWLGLFGLAGLLGLSRGTNPTPRRNVTLDQRHYR